MKYNIRKFVEKFAAGEFDSNDRSVQIEAGWYDWFCSDTALASKTKALGKKLTQLIKSEKIDVENMYVFFKNNCPMNGPLYDDFRICDMKTGDVIFNITPKSGHSGKAEVWGKENSFQYPLASGKWKDIKIFFGV
jgi:hypothetical protein